MADNNVVRGLDATPTVASKNITGSSLSSTSGTPSKFGVYRLTVHKDGGVYYVDAIEQFGGGSKQSQVRPSGTDTALIPGLTITFGATLNDGDHFEIAYNDAYVVNTQA